MAAAIRAPNPHLLQARHCIVPPCLIKYAKVGTGRNLWFARCHARKQRGGDNKHMYYGWAVVAAGMLANAFMVGAFYSSYGLFVLPVGEEFGLSRADANTGLVIVSLGIAVISPFLGRLLDRMSVRKVMKTGAVFFGGGLVALSFSTNVLLSLAILSLIMPMGIMGACSMTVPLLIVRWFKVLPARAMLISNLGLSLGGATLPLLSAYLIEGHGWRTALMVLGGLSGIAMFAVGVIMRDHPGADDIETAKTEHARESIGEEPVSVGALLRSPLFWIVNLCGALVIATGTAFTVSLAPFARDHGLSLVEAASLLSAMSAAGFAGKLILAAIGDRFDKALILAGTYIGGALAVMMIVFSADFASMLAGVAIIGFISGFTTPILNAVIADTFGRESFGTVTGLAQPLQSLASMAAIRFAGEVFDRTGRYDIFLYTKIIIGLIAGAAMIRLTVHMRSAKARQE